MQATVQCLVKYSWV